MASKSCVPIVMAWPATQYGLECLNRHIHFMEITEIINNNYVVRVVDGCRYVTICALLQLKYMFPAKKKKNYFTPQNYWLELHANEFSAENEISGN